MKSLAAARRAKSCTCSSVKDADEIIVLNEGCIAERGTHEELLAQRGYYWETFCLQNGIEADPQDSPDGDDPLKAKLKKEAM